MPMKPACCGFRALLCVVVLHFSCNCLKGQQEQYGREITGDELALTLEMLANQVRANYERIESWTGRIEYQNSHFVTTQPNPALEKTDQWKSMEVDPDVISDAKQAGASEKGFWEITRGQAVFELDGRTQKYRVLNKPDHESFIWEGFTSRQFRTTAHLDNLFTFFGTDRSIDFCADRYFSRHPKVPVEFPKARIAFEKSSKAAKGVKNLIDVRDCFTAYQLSYRGKGYYWEQLENIVACLKGERSPEEQERAKLDTHLFVTADSPLLFTLVNGKRDEGHLILQFDGSVGLNVVHAAANGGDKKLYWRRTSYKEVSQIYLPVEFHSTNHGYSTAGDRINSFVRTLRIETDGLNDPIDPATFELSSVGLKYADRKIDETSGERFVFDNGNGFVPEAEFVFDEAKWKLAYPEEDKVRRVPVKARGSRVVLYINAIVAAVVVAFLIYRRRFHKS